jgi:signal transduction histidine kinase
MADNRGFLTSAEAAAFPAGPQPRPLRLDAERLRHQDELEHTVAEHTTAGRAANAQLQRELHQRQRVDAELADARRRLAESREADRLFLARELHDSALQQLIGISYQLAQARRNARDPHWPVAQRLAELTASQRAVLDVVQQLRQLIGELRPAGLDEFGLPTALAGYVAHLQRASSAPLPAITLDLPESGITLPRMVALCLFRVAQEALRNALKHAQARTITLSFRHLGNEVLLSVRDDGRGFALPAHLSELARADHFGLIGIAERVAEVGGHLTIDTQLGMGTTLTIHLPLPTPEETHERVDPSGAGG